jgi:predicted ferric reductase
MERWVGANRLLLWHRELGGFLVVIVLAHVGLILGGYALIDHTSPLHETWLVLTTTYQNMVSAVVAAGILLAVAGLAIRSARARMSYEAWKRIHLATYAILLLSYGHEFADGQELETPGYGRTYWISLYVIVLGCLVWGRLVRPLWMNMYLNLRVADVVDEGPDMVSVYVSGRHLEKLNARAGQFFRWRFLTRELWRQSHPFSLSAAPNRQWLRLTVKAVGDHTDDLHEMLQPGDRVTISGPSGDFTADRRTRFRALLIAGGSGIAPIRALLEVLPPRTIVLYRASRWDEIVFRDELEWLAHARGGIVVFVVGPRDAPGPRRALSPGGLRELVPDVHRRDVYLCGPDGLIAASLDTLDRLRVPRKQIHLDPFEF